MRRETWKIALQCKTDWSLNIKKESEGKMVPMILSRKEISIQRLFLCIRTSIWPRVYSLERLTGETMSTQIVLFSLRPRRYVYKTVNEKTCPWQIIQNLAPKESSERRGSSWTAGQRGHGGMRGGSGTQSVRQGMADVEDEEEPDEGLQEEDQDLDQHRTRASVWVERKQKWTWESSSKSSSKSHKSHTQWVSLFIFSSQVSGVDLSLHEPFRC